MTEAVQKDETITNLTRAYNDFNALNIRLNTEPVVQRYELLLKGEKVDYFVDDSGELKEVKTQVGIPKANSTGIQNIINWISGVINSQVVQGNFMIDKKGYSEKYENFVCWFRKDFGDYLVANIYTFDIDEMEIMGLIDQALFMVMPFMSRLIGNEERKGFGQSVKQTDTSVLKNKAGIPFLSKSQ